MKIIKTTLILGLAVSGAALAIEVIDPDAIGGQDQNLTNIVKISKLKDSGLTPTDVAKIQAIQELDARQKLAAYGMYNSDVDFAKLTKISKIRDMDLELTPREKLLLYHASNSDRDHVFDRADIAKMKYLQGQGMYPGHAALLVKHRDNAGIHPVTDPVFNHKMAVILKKASQPDG